MPDVPIASRQVFGNMPSSPGEGRMIGIKLALQVFSEINPMLIISPEIGKIVKYMNYPSIVSSEPLASSRGLSHALGRNVLVLASDSATAKRLTSFKDLRGRITYVCLNGSDLGIDRQLVFRVKAEYRATASVSFPEDFVKKLMKCKNCAGFSFIDVHCPSPKSWGYDPSNTIEIGRAAVNAYVWPLIEFEGDMPVLTFKPEIQELLETYVKMQSRFGSNDIEKLGKIVSENLEIIKI
jgi:hypothetical protein